MKDAGPPPEEPGAHISVMAESALEWLAIRPDGVYVDCTAGMGGHAEAIVRRLESGRLIALDRDSEAVRQTKERLRPYPQATVLCANYGALEAVLDQAGVSRADGILIDAGISSSQLDDPVRGFTFQQEGPLDMRMNPAEGLSASELLARSDSGAIERILREYGDVRPVKRLAAGLTERARAGRLTTTTALVEAIQDILNVHHKIPEEVRTVFQALRIAVNAELEHLGSGLRQAAHRLGPGGRLVAITFHSGEDRVVKQVFKEYGRPRHERYPDGRTKQTIPPLLRILTRGPVQPSREEIAQNRRSQSAKLRAAERLENDGG